MSVYLIALLFSTRASRRKSLSNLLLHLGMKSSKNSSKNVVELESNEWHFTLVMILNIYIWLSHSKRGFRFLLSLLLSFFASFFDSYLEDRNLRLIWCTPEDLEVTTQRVMWGWKLVTMGLVIIIGWCWGWKKKKEKVVFYFLEGSVSRFTTLGSWHSPFSFPSAEIAQRLLSLTTHKTRIFARKKGEKIHTKDGGWWLWKKEKAERERPKPSKDIQMILVFFSPFDDGTTWNQQQHSGQESPSITILPILSPVTLTYEFSSFHTLTLSHTHTYSLTPSQNLFLPSCKQ